MWKAASLSSCSKFNYNLVISTRFFSTKAPRTLQPHVPSIVPKLFLLGLPKTFYANHTKILQFLNKINVDQLCKGESVRGGVKLLFANEADFDKGKSILTEYIENHNKELKDNKPSPESPRVKPLSLLTQDEMKLVDPKKTPNTSPNILDHVTPLYNVPYEEQLKIKSKQVRTVLNYICKCASVPSIPIDTIIPSPVTHNYRNSASYTIGYGPNEQTLVGFCVRSSTKMETVVDPSVCIHINKNIEKVRNIFQEYVQTSPLHPYSKIQQKGFFRILDVKYFSTGQGFAILTVNPDNINEREYDKFLGDVARFVKKRTEEEGVPLVAFGIRTYTGISTPDPGTPVSILWGEPAAHEKLLNFQFRVSLGSFFQPNTAAAEKMFQLIRSWAPRLGPKAALLDVCCGTGTIGIMLSDLYSGVIGVESVSEAIQDATYNAELNGRKNMLYYNKKVEEATNSLLLDLPNSEFVAVLDPPRAGVHPSVITALRKNPQIKYVIYISCDASNGLLHNGKKLMLSSGPSVSDVFVPIKAAIVDMFPHTSQCEAVVLFKRK